MGSYMDSRISSSAVHVTCYLVPDVAKGETEDRAAVLKGESVFARGCVSRLLYFYCQGRVEVRLKRRMDICSFT
jgi:hypothetical protein